jgi:hypothetical protein
MFEFVIISECIPNSRYTELKRKKTEEDRRVGIGGGPGSESILIVGIMEVVWIQI